MGAISPKVLGESTELLSVAPFGLRWVVLPLGRRRIAGWRGRAFGDCTAVRVFGDLLWMFREGTKRRISDGSR